MKLTSKDFNVGVDLGGVYGNQIFRTWGSLESPFQRVNYSAVKMDRWHGAGTSNWVPIISQETGLTTMVLPIILKTEVISG